MKKRVISLDKRPVKAIATIVAVLVVIVIILAAGLGYVALTKSSVSTVTSTLTTVTSGAPTTVVSTNTITSTQTASSCTATPLLLYTADAYVNESAALESGFAAQTCVPIVTAQAQGATADAALIAAGDPVSVFVSVSRPAVEGPDLGSEFPGWAVAFATDQMGIAYTSASTTTPAAKAALTAYNTAVSTNTTNAWYEFFQNITSGAVKVGISNPNLDPAGFRAWMVLQLASIAYDGGTANQQYFVNRMLTNQGNVTGASAAALIPALSTGQINFLFIYKSNIASEGLSLMQLTNGVNLALPSYNSFYGQVTYTTYSGSTATNNKGSAIVLWLSVPLDATDMTQSVNFVVYTIQNAQTVLKNYELTTLSPAQLYNTTGFTVPPPIVSLLNVGTLVDEGPV